MYSAKVLEHLENPRNVGVLADDAVKGSATNPVCGDLLDLYVKIADGKIVVATFQAQACPPCIAAASVLTELIAGLSVAAASELQAADVTNALESLPRNKEHCATLAIDALQDAILQISRTN